MISGYRDLAFQSFPEGGEYDIGDVGDAISTLISALTDESPGKLFQLPPERLRFAIRSGDSDYVTDDFEVTFLDRYASGEIVPYPASDSFDVLEDWPFTGVSNAYSCGASNFAARIASRSGGAGFGGYLTEFLDGSESGFKVVYAASYVESVAEAVDSYLWQAGTLLHQIEDGIVSEDFRPQVALLGKAALSLVADFGATLITLLLHAKYSIYPASGFDESGGCWDTCSVASVGANWLCAVSSALGLWPGGMYSLFDYNHWVWQFGEFEGEAIVPFISVMPCYSTDGFELVGQICSMTTPGVENEPADFDVVASGSTCTG
jgi:hypothetical protein